MLPNVCQPPLADFWGPKLSPLHDLQVKTRNSVFPSQSAPFEFSGGYKGEGLLAFLSVNTVCKVSLSLSLLIAP